MEPAKNRKEKWILKPKKNFLIIHTRNYSMDHSHLLQPAFVLVVLAVVLEAFSIPETRYYVLLI
jgi:hypothetical protein